MESAADIVLILHFFFFLFCVGGEAAILAGAPLKIEWIRNRRFRLVHLIAVVFVGVEGAVGFLCPLTSWEYALRRAAGQSIENEIPLVPRIIRAMLFYDFPQWAFTLIYVGFAALVLATYILLPPERR